MPTCSLCGVTFHNWPGYKEHVIDIHGIRWSKEIPADRPDILPVKFSQRTTKQIVQEAESTWLAPFLVGGN